MTPFELREMIASADWSNQTAKDLAGLLCDLWVAVEEDKRQLSILPFRIVDSEQGKLVVCQRDLWRKWLHGSSTDVDLILLKIRAIK